MTRLGYFLSMGLILFLFLAAPCFAVIPPIVSEGWIDGRLACGNGLVFATFAGPMEEPAYPFNKISDKICRLWFNYASPQQCSISLQPCIQDYTHSEAITLVEGVDSYEYLDSTGIVHMVTDYPYFTVHSYTYGPTTWSGTALSGKQALVRKITVVPKGNYDLGLRTFVSLYPEYTKWVYHADDREDIPTLTFAGTETVTYTAAAKRAIWDYNDSPRNLPFKKLCIGLMETPTSYQIGRNSRQINTQADYSADNAFRYGGPSFKSNTTVIATGSNDWANAAFERRVTGSSAFSLTAIIAFGDTTTAAQTVFDGIAADPDANYTTTYNAWNSWRAGGSIITTGQPEVDKAYKNALVYGKMSQSSNGAIVIGGRYQIMCYWIRDMMVGASCFMDTGFYEDAKLAMDHIRLVNAEWDNQYNCLFSNYHASGLRTNPLIQPNEWTIKMGGPQLEGMGDYLYCMAKYYRHTGDLVFINTNWTKISQVANALMADNEPNFDKYRFGLMYEGGEAGYYANETSHNAQAILGFRSAYDLSVARGSPVTAWRDKADALEFEFHRQLVDKQNWQWTPNSIPSNAGIVIDDNNSHTGKSSLKITNNGAATTNIYSNAIPINQGEAYTFKIYSKNEGSTAGVYLRYLDSSQNVIFVTGNPQQDFVGLSNHADFTQTVANFNAPNLGNLAYVHVFIQVNSSSAQTVWFDDVSLTRTQGSGSVQNPSFETGNSYLWDLINADPPRPSNHAAHGYPMYMGTVFPQLDSNQRYMKDLVSLMSPDGDPDGWGIWTPTRATAATIAHNSDVAWNYISKLTAKLVPSKAIHEQNDKCMPAAAPVEDLTTWTRLGVWTDDVTEGEANIYAVTAGNDVHKTINMAQSSYVTFILRYWAFPNQGISEFYINNVLKATIDHYRTSPQWVEVNIGTFLVSSGNKTFKITVGGRTNHTENWVNLGKLIVQYPSNIAAYKADTEANGVLPRQAYVLGGYGLKYPHAVFCSFSGFNPKERSGNYKMEPQVPNAFGTEVINTSARVRNTRFNIQTSGRGDYPTTFTLDGGNVPSSGLLPSNIFNGSTHAVVMAWSNTPPSLPYPVLEDTTAKLMELYLSSQSLVVKVEGQADHEVRIRSAPQKWCNVEIYDQALATTTNQSFQTDPQGFLSIPIHCGAGTNTLTLTITPPLPDKASSPSPAHLAGGISVSASLSWAVAAGATSYDVYFDTVNPPLSFQGNQTLTTFDPAGELNALTTYYWRIDSVGDAGTIEGDIWSFTTGSYLGDFDLDGDVDQPDYGHLQLCFSGPGVAFQPGCEAADVDDDIDVDSSDFNQFQACMAGADQPPPVTCPH